MNEVTDVESELTDKSFFGVSYPEEPNYDANSPMVQHLLDRGVHPLLISDEGSHYLVEWDIRYPKEVASGDARAKQRRDPNLVSQNKVGNIILDATDLVGTTWLDALNAAVNAYNSVSGSKVFLTVRTNNPSSYDTRVEYDGDIGVTGYNASSPRNGNPGPIIQFGYNPDYTYDSPYPSATTHTVRVFRTGVALHELGHTLGLEHTNDPAQGAHISGTPTTDLGSAMAAMPESDQGQTVLSTGDKKALRILYPSSTTTPSNSAPTADFTHSTAGTTAYFSDLSSDLDGSITDWYWHFDDGSGSASSAQNPTYTYSASGTYDVTLTVTDDDGAQHTVMKSISVTAGSFGGF